MNALCAGLLILIRGTAYASNESTTAAIAGPATIEGRCSPVTVSASMALNPAAAKPGVFISKVDIYSGIYACGSDAKQTTDSVSYRYDAASSESVVVLPPGTGHGSTLVEIAPGYVYQADAPAVPPIPPGPYSSTNDSKAEEMKGYGTAWHGDARVTINWDCCAFKPQAAAAPPPPAKAKPAKKSRGFWDLVGTMRGNEVERVLGRDDPRNTALLGKLDHYYPVVDIVRDNGRKVAIISIVSIDMLKSNGRNRQDAASIKRAVREKIRALADLKSEGARGSKVRAALGTGNVTSLKGLVTRDGESKQSSGVIQDVNKADRSICAAISSNPMPNAEQDAALDAVIAEASAKRIKVKLIYLDGSEKPNARNGACD